MLMKIRHVSDFTWSGLQHVKPHHTSQTLLHNPPLVLAVSDLKEKQALQPLSSHKRLQKYGKKHTRDFAVYSNVDPAAGVPPSGPPPNILSWIVGLAIAVALPFVKYKWGPFLKDKIVRVLQVTEDVVEAVEKVAEEVDKVAEHIADDLPEGGKFRNAVDFVENVAERIAKDAGAVDDFIDNVQGEEEKAESLVESVKDEFDKLPKESNVDDPKDQNSTA